MKDLRTNLVIILLIDDFIGLRSDQMAKNIRSPTYSDQSAVSEESLPMRCFRWCTRHIPGMGPAFSKCPYCSFQAPEAAVVLHLNECQRVTRTITESDGSMASITYAGPRNDIKAALRRAAYNDQYNSRADDYKYLE